MHLNDLASQLALDRFWLLEQQAVLVPLRLACWQHADMKWLPLPAKQHPAIGSSQLVRATLFCAKKQVPKQ